MSQTTTIDEVLIDEIVRRIRDAARVSRIILFGSAVSGNMSADSDVDLLVLEDEPSDVRQEMVRLRAALRGLGFPFDVVVMSSKRFEETKQVIGGLAHPAFKYGRVVYDAS
jgi:predicted nucleotidyltransferase